VRCCILYVYTFRLAQPPKIVPADSGAPRGHLLLLLQRPDTTWVDKAIQWQAHGIGIVSRTSGSRHSVVDSDYQSWERQRHPESPICWSPQLTVRTSLHMDSADTALKSTPGVLAIDNNGPPSSAICHCDHLTIGRPTLPLGSRGALRSLAATPAPPSRRLVRSPGCWGHDGVT